MNRKKAIKKKFVRKLKQERARNSVQKKERYISKAERAEMNESETSSHPDAQLKDENQSHLKL